MHVLETEQAAFDGTASETQWRDLVAYCRQDVFSMFKIYRRCARNRVF